MERAEALPAAVQRDVKDVFFELLVDCGGLQRPPACLNRRLQRDLGLIDGLTGGWALSGGQLAEGLKLCGEQAFLAEVFHAYLIQRPQIGGLVRGSDGLLQKLSQIAHMGSPSDSRARRTRLPITVLAG